MVNKKTARCLAYGIAMGALSLAPAVNAQDATTNTGGAMAGTGMMDSSAMMQPMQVTGQVLRYYVDRSGYVTAMDVQTANGVQMVRFAPGMGQRIYSTYPVGGQASVYVMGSPGSMGMMNYNVIGMGDRMPAAGFMAPNMVSDIDLLKSEPYIMAGSKMVQFSGKLRNAITDENGEVVGLVLSGVNPNAVMGGMMGAGMTNTSMSGGAMTSTTTDASMGAGSMGGMMGGGMMAGDVLVRVPREFRHPNAGAMGGTERATPLFPGALVEVVGYPEAPRYGVLSRFGQRIAASALVLNGRAAGAVGMPKMSPGNRTLLNLNIGPDATEEERRARSMGFMTYDPNTGQMGGSMGSGTMGGGTTGTGTGTNTTP